MLAKLRTLGERQFENLAFDVLALSGVQNLIWRTPGSDGGRDLEGIVSRVDFSGGVVSERWYFECKRYNASISWPVVFEKISYASNAGADYLLFISTSSFSPQCTDEVTLWNNQKKHPLIRHWPGHQLVVALDSFPKVLAKYGLTSSNNVSSASTLALSLELAKSVQASYASEEFKKSPSHYIELAVSLAELLTGRLADLESNGAIIARRAVSDGINGLAWLTFEPSGALPVDSLALRALLSALRLGNRAAGLILTQKPGTTELIIRNSTGSLSAYGAIAKLVTEICFWGNLEIEECDQTLIVRGRVQDV